MQNAKPCKSSRTKSYYIRSNLLGRILEIGYPFREGIVASNYASYQWRPKTLDIATPNCVLYLIVIAQSVKRDLLFSTIISR